MVLLDRDGVVNNDVGAPGVIRTEQLELTPNAATAIGNLQRSGCHVALVTNQSCVGKGLLSKPGLDEIHALLQEMLRQGDKDAVLNAIHVCTSTRRDNDPRMKPKPGMILEASRNFELESSAFQSVFVGDTLTDLQAATAGGVSLKILVQTGYGFGLMDQEEATLPPRLVTSTANEELNSVTPFVYAQNLDQAVSWLLGHETGPC